MTTENQAVTEKNCALHHWPRVCWSAVLTGALVGVGLGFLLHMFGLAIGLTAYRSSADGATAIAIGGILGMLIGVIASMGVAGFVSGYLGRFYYSHCNGGVIYGFITWSIALLLSAIFVIPLTHYINAYTKELAPVAVATTAVQQMDDSAAETSPAVKRDQIANAGGDTQATRDAMTYSAWILFVLFFVGALSSCIGACIGMNCKCKDMYLDDHHHHDHHHHHHDNVTNTEPPASNLR